MCKAPTWWSRTVLYGGGEEVLPFLSNDKRHYSFYKFILFYNLDTWLKTDKTFKYPSAVSFYDTHREASKAETFYVGSSVASPNATLNRRHLLRRRELVELRQLKRYDRLL